MPRKPKTAAERWGRAARDRAYDRGVRRTDPRLRAARRVHQSRRWQRTRERYLDSVGRLCEECARRGRTTLADQVHHVEHPFDAPERAYHHDNLEALCHRCHRSRHA